MSEAGRHGNRMASRGLSTIRRMRWAFVCALALALVAVLSGCADRLEAGIVVESSGAWSGTATFFFATPVPLPSDWAAQVDARVQGETAALAGLGIEATTTEATTQSGGLEYSFLLQGADLDALANLVSETAAVGEGLAGPIALELSGPIRGGEMLRIALPANPSTGYGWAAAPVQGAEVAVAGEVESRQVGEMPGSLARQVIRFQAIQTGPAAVRLTYRRPWEEDVAATRVLSVQSDSVDLTRLMAALSMPVPDAIDETPPPSSPTAQPASQSSPQTLLPGYYSWCDLGGCTPIRDQGGCGSCWAFGTVGVLESAIKIKQGLTTDLSEQYLVSCNNDGWSCGGGWWAHNYHQWKYLPPETKAGAVPESEFGYLGWDAPCGGPYSHPYRIDQWYYVGGSDSVPPVADIKQAIYDHGPVAVGICTGSYFGSYTGGVFTHDETCYDQWGNEVPVNHAVVLVGWDDLNQAWILRNSWGSGWGENGGYMRIRYGISNVGYGASYIVYSPPSPPSHWIFVPTVLRSAGNYPPSAPSSPTPPNGTTNVFPDVNLSWNGGDPDGDAVTYDVYLEANNGNPGVLLCDNASSPYCDPGMLTTDTQYYWKVVATDVHGASTTGPVWTFRTSALPGGAIPNGDFEEGPGQGWTEGSTGGYPVIVDTDYLQFFNPGVTPHGGDWAAWLGGAYNDTSYIMQLVRVPPEMPYLAYYHWKASEEDMYHCGDDAASVLVNGTPVQIYFLCDLYDTPGWERHTVNLGGYAGQTVVLRMEVTTDGEANSNLFVDDMSFSATAAEELPGIAPTGPVPTEPKSSRQ